MLNTMPCFQHLLAAGHYPRGFVDAQAQPMSGAVYELGAVAGCFQRAARRAVHLARGHSRPHRCPGTFIGLTHRPISPQETRAADRRERQRA